MRTFLLSRIAFLVVFVPGPATSQEAPTTPAHVIERVKDPDEAELKADIVQRRLEVREARRHGDELDIARSEQRLRDAYAALEEFRWTVAY